MHSRLIVDLIADEYPKAVIARRVGITRQDLYNFLTPRLYSQYHLSDAKLHKIAAFEGRAFSRVRAEYLAKVAA